ncbi:MAG: response regulator, partial [Rhodospirillaceae bacterium]|nr:response regulator [Rhodospirillaceae bacterium]
MSKDGRRILIVDDDFDFAESVSDILEMSGHDVVTVHSGEAAIECFRTESFDLALIDVQMPGKNGVESFLEICAIQPRVHAVIMTGYSVPGLLDTAFLHGALGVLKKPLDIPKLIEYVEQPPQPQTALIVDDDSDFCDCLHTMLQNKGIISKIALNADAALRIIRAPGMIDVLLLDLKMHPVDGAALYQEIKKLGVSFKTLIITAHGDLAVEAMKG